jgi:hypothetical protein
MFVDVMPLGCCILASQSNTGNLLQPPAPQAPLFLHPAGRPPRPEEQLLQAIQEKVYMINGQNPTVQS